MSRSSSSSSSSSSSTGTGAPRGERWREQHGVTLIELLVAMIMTLVLSLAAFSILEFATADVSRITSRVHADQTGRTALEKIMLQLHSSCVALEVNPIVEGSTSEKLRFISENGETPALETVHEHEIVYSKSAGTLIEKTYVNTGTESKGNYPFSTTASTTTKLLTGVKQTVNAKKEEIPIFQYYRYYKTGDTIPEGDKELPYGELNPKPMESKELEKEIENVAKVTVSFTLAPEGHESIVAKGGQPVALEDSAVFRLTPSSTSSEHLNAPCSEAP
jgi:prepilin-type N-terminal cleavage/methylation domain-containing protein